MVLLLGLIFNAGSTRGRKIFVRSIKRIFIHVCDSRDYTYLHQSLQAGIICKRSSSVVVVVIVVVVVVIVIVVVIVVIIVVVDVGNQVDHGVGRSGG